MLQSVGNSPIIWWACIPLMLHKCLCLFNNCLWGTVEQCHTWTHGLVIVTAFCRNVTDKKPFCTGACVAIFCTDAVVVHASKDVLTVDVCCYLTVCTGERWRWVSNPRSVFGIGAGDWKMTGQKGQKQALASLNNPISATATGTKVKFMINFIQVHQKLVGRELNSILLNKYPGRPRRCTRDISEQVKSQVP